MKKIIYPFNSINNDICVKRIESHFFKSSFIDDFMKMKLYLRHLEKFDILKKKATEIVPDTHGVTVRYWFCILVKNLSSILLS